jgi:predicted amidohydrolase
MTEKASGTFRIAAVQMEPKIGHTADNVARSLERIAQASQLEADLVLLPELCNTGYVFETRDEALALSEAVPNGPTCAAWITAAKTHSLIIVAGITERDGDKLYNSAVIVGPDGYIGTYRKNHLWGAENTIFEPGNLGVPVFDIGVGRIACAICYDIWFPEIFRLAALQGADLLCVSTNWVPMPEQPGNFPMMANILAMGGAHGQSFLGSSLIVSHTGWPIAGPASVDREELLIADIDLKQARANRHLTEYNERLRDRRTDLYGEMLGADAQARWD